MSWTCYTHNIENIPENYGCPDCDKEGVLIQPQLTDEEFLSFSMEERVQMVARHIGIKYNRIVADTMAIAEELGDNHEDETLTEESVEYKITEQMVATLFEELIKEANEIVNGFNMLCDDVMIVDVRFGEIDIERRICQVIPQYIKLKKGNN